MSIFYHQVSILKSKFKQWLSTISTTKNEHRNYSWFDRWG